MEVWTLDTRRTNEAALRLTESLQSSLVGQDEAIQEVSRFYQIYTAGLNDPDRPVANLLLMGSTGSGKTFLCEEVARILLGNASFLLRIDCAEFEHDHEVAKLIGAPPGYLGHRDTKARLDPELLKAARDPTGLSVILFDEVEKAADSLWQLLLGVLSKGILTLGDNRVVDMRRSLIFLTSNLGAKEIERLAIGGIGFQKEGVQTNSIREAARAATRKRFSPEFMNRLDRVIVFNTLNSIHFSRILELELAKVRHRIAERSGIKFTIRLTNSAKQFLLSQGLEPAFGARSIKRAVEKLLVCPVSNLLTTSQIGEGDIIRICYQDPDTSLTFERVCTA